MSTDTPDSATRYSADWKPYDTHAGTLPRGLLFVGDPHISQRRPGRRTDEDFASVALDKLEQSLRKANDLDLLAVLLGDLFQAPRDATPWLFSRLFGILERAKYRPITNLGNHDKVETRLTEDCSLWTLARSGAIHVMHTEDTRACLVRLDDGPVALLGVPYGTEVPHEIDSPCAPERTVLVTHEDFDFGGAYPGAKSLHAVTGASLLVNGHMHDTKPAEQRGGTLCLNPGNILRQSVDMRHHLPAVWSWRPGEAPLAHPLSVRPASEVFDLTGLQVVAAGVEAVAAEMVDPDSLFAQMLASESPLDQGRTQDGAFLEEEFAAVLRENAVEPTAPVAIILRTMMQQALDESGDEGMSPHG